VSAAQTNTSRRAALTFDGGPMPVDAEKFLVLLPPDAEPVA
jgi:hypothetical protein